MVVGVAVMGLALLQEIVVVTMLVSVAVVVRMRV